MIIPAFPDCPKLALRQQQLPTTTQVKLKACEVRCDKSAVRLRAQPVPSSRRRRPPAHTAPSRPHALLRTPFIIRTCIWHCQVIVLPPWTCNPLGTPPASTGRSRGKYTYFSHRMEYIATRMHQCWRRCGLLKICNTLPHTQPQQSWVLSGYYWKNILYTNCTFQTWQNDTFQLNHIIFRTVSYFRYWTDISYLFSSIMNTFLIAHCICIYLLVKA